MKVTYIDHMSSDLGVVNAARVSFSKQSDWDEEWVTVDDRYPSELLKTLKEKDTKLIHYLAEHGHYLPFRHPHISFHCKAPIFVARQAGKHQVGMSWSEVSRRYVDDEPEFFTPEVWRKRASDKKQGSSNTETVDMPINKRTLWGFAEETYLQLIKAGVAPEQARMVLPQSMYTEWVWTGSLLSWSHFIKLRTDSHAQKEIQDFANMFVPTLEQLFPVSWKALNDLPTSTA